MGRHVLDSQSRTVAWSPRARILQGRAVREDMSAPHFFVGMDVAKAQLDIAVRPSGERWAVALTPGLPASWCGSRLCSPR